MKPRLLLSVLTLALLVTAVGVAFADVVTVDGTPALIEQIDLPGKTQPSGDGRTIDIVGDTSNSNAATGLAKGNAYRVDMSVMLDEAEFWLNYTPVQTLTYYVFESPVEFGTYTEVYRNSASVAGLGAGWYSTGPIAVPLYAGTYYIIAVSWDGFLTYYYGTGDSQATSFGAYVHGHATGTNPLPGSFQSTVNDQAIYHQRLTTSTISGVEESTWGQVKALFR